MYPNDDAYNAFNGIDLLPDADRKFIFDSPFGRSQSTYLTKRALEHVGTLDGKLNEGHCDEVIGAASTSADVADNATADGTPSAMAGWWSTQRVGPLMSRGGGARYQLGWADAGRLGPSLDAARLAGQSLGVTALVAAPVDDQGAILGSPPLLVAQLSVTPGGGTYRDWGTWHCILDPEGGCVDLAVLTAMRADRTPTLATEEAAFMASYLDSTGAPAYTKLIDRPLALRAEICDIRPHGSPPIMWHAQLAMRIERRVATAQPAALSTHEAHNPMYVCPGQLGCLSQAIRIPIGVDSFFFYTGRMPSAGVLLSGHVHARKSLMRRSLLFDATPQQLGFAPPPWSPFWSQEGTRLFMWQIRTRARMWPRMAHEPMKLGEEGFDSFEELEQHVLSSLNEASREAARAAERGDSITGSWFSPYPSRDPKLVCSATGQHRATGGSRVHRPHASCGPWRFERLQQYTVLSLQGAPEGTDVGSATLGEFDAGHNSDLDALTYQHDVWSLEYAADDGVSRYTVDFGSVVPDALANTTSSGKSIYLWNLPHLYLYRGTPPYSPTLYCHMLYAFISAHYVFGEFQALLFLPPRHWGLVDGALGLNAPVLAAVALFALVFPLLLLLIAHVLVSPEAYSLDPCDVRLVAKGDAAEDSDLVDVVRGAGKGPVFLDKDAASKAAEKKLQDVAELEALSRSSEVADVRPLDHGVERIRRDLPTVSRLVLTMLTLFVLFIGWGHYDAIFLVGVIGPSTSIDMMPFLAMFAGYVIFYWTEGYEIRTGRIRPTVRAATALSFPQLSKYPVVPFAAFLGAAGQLLTVHQFALLRLAGAGPMNIWAYVIYKPLVAVATLTVNTVVVYYANAIRASRFAYLQQGKKIPILVLAERAARQHRFVILVGSLLLVVVFVPTVGLLMPYLLAYAPLDGAATTLTALTARILPLPVVLLDLLASAILVPFTSTLIVTPVCAGLVTSQRIDRVPDGALVNHGPIFGMHRLPTVRRGLLWGACCGCVHALPLVGWMLLTGARGVPLEDYRWWKAAFTLTITVLYGPRTLWWGLAAASLPEPGDDVEAAPLGGWRGGVGGDAHVDAYARLQEEHSSSEDGDSGDDDIEDGDSGDENERMRVGAAGAFASTLASQGGIASASTLEAAKREQREMEQNGKSNGSKAKPRIDTEEDTQKYSPLVRDGSPRSIWGDLCTASLYTLAALAVLLRLHALANLLVPQIVALGFGPALAYTMGETLRNGGPPRDAAVGVVMCDQILLSVLMITHAILLRQRRWPMLVLLLFSPTCSLAVLLSFLYPRGEERYFTAGRLAAERLVEQGHTRPLPGYPHFRLPGRSALMRIACVAVGCTSALLPHVSVSPWIALHGHFNYMDALSESHENPYSAVVWADDLLRLATLLLSLMLTFRYVPTSEVVSAALPRVMRSLADLLLLKMWLLPAFVLVYTTPTAAMALSLWAHLWHMSVRIITPSDESEAEGGSGGDNAQAPSTAPTTHAKEPVASRSRNGSASAAAPESTSPRGSRRGPALMADGTVQRGRQATLVSTTI